MVPTGIRVQLCHRLVAPNRSRPHDQPSWPHSTLLPRARGGTDSFSCFVVSPPQGHGSCVANFHVRRFGVGSVTKRLLSSTASKAHGSASWRGMDGECTYRLHLLEDSATALLHASCTYRCSQQRCTATFLLRFHRRMGKHRSHAEALSRVRLGEQRLCVRPQAMWEGEHGTPHGKVQIGNTTN